MSMVNLPYPWNTRKSLPTPIVFWPEKAMSIGYLKSLQGKLNGWEQLKMPSSHAMGK